MNTTIVRGCGTRVAGGIYATCPLSANGQPVDHFLHCPPVEIDLEAMGVTPVGVKLIVDSFGVGHVIDWIGSDAYPNVADFVEEVKRYGLSRRLPKTLEFARLGPKSRIILVHARAVIQNRAAMYAATDWRCPKEIADHCVGDAFDDGNPSDMCAGLWWEDVETGDQFGVEGGREVARVMPAFSYNARRRPPEFRPTYKPAAFMSLPIAALDVIRDRVAGTHEVAEAAASRANLPVVMEDQ